MSEQFIPGKGPQPEHRPIVPENTGLGRKAEPLGQGVEPEQLQSIPEGTDPIPQRPSDGLGNTPWSPKRYFNELNIPHFEMPSHRVFSDPALPRGMIRSEESRNLPGEEGIKKQLQSLIDAIKSIPGT